MAALRLYRLPVSACCSGVLVALRYKGVPFEDSEPPGGHFDEQLGQWRPGYGTAEYKKHVPLGTIPAVVLLSQTSEVGELTLSESSTICEWLDECFPPPRFPPLLPPLGQANSRAKLRWVIRFHDLYLDPKIKQLFKHVDPRQRNDDDVVSILSELAARLAHLAEVAEGYGEGKLGDAVFDGHAFSLVDCQVPLNISLAQSLVNRLRGYDLLAGHGRLERWHQSVLRHPAVVDAASEASIATSEWLERKGSGNDSAFEEGWYSIKPAYKNIPQSSGL